MAHYQITTAESGKCLQRLVEDVYDANGNIVTNVLGNWEPCRRGTVGISGRVAVPPSGNVPSFKAPKALRSVQMVQEERVNILMVSVIVVMVALILYKLR